MPKIATPSAFDVAYWFLDYAENKHLFLEDEKIHHLLFLAQIAFMQNNANEILFPSMFIVTEKGFLEPNLLKVFANGHPFMPHIKIDDKTAAFLEKIWVKYAHLSLVDLRASITQSKAFISCFDKNNLQAVDLQQIVSLFSPGKEKISHNKIRMSQHGPVVVSQWQPRKVNKKD